MIGQPDLGVAPDHAFVLGPIGLGYDRVNDRLLVQLEELVEADVDDDDDDERRRRAPADATSRRPRPHPLLRHPQPGRRVLRARRSDRRRRTAAVPVVRQPDRPARTPVPAHELSNAAGDRIELAVGPVPADAADASPTPSVTVLGRMRNASNATFLVRLDGADGPGDLQARARRTAAVGLPARAVPARGRRLRAQRGARPRRRPADRAAPRRPARRGIAAVVRQRRLRRALLLAVRRTARAPRPAAGDRRVRRRSPTTPTARAGTACSRSTGTEAITCGPSTTACASRPRTSCAR